MNIRSLLPFLAITFGLAWGLVGLLILFPDQTAAVFDELNAKNPLFIMAVYAPAIAAFALVIRHGDWGWYAFLLTCGIYPWIPAKSLPG